jgi:hypothetical protein
MTLTTPILTKAKAVAVKQMSYLEIVAKSIIALIVIDYGTLLDLLSGTLED